MAIKVTFPEGQNTASVGGLYQWDYGQTLEIESNNLRKLTEVEVHFACSGMSEAIVHACSVTNGVATVEIPNRCLEQSSNISVWVYEINGTLGRTINTITLYVTARVRPSNASEIPQNVSNRYTELISEVNEAVGKLTSGEVIVAKATEAQKADSATTAGNAQSATSATSANFATAAAVLNLPQSETLYGMNEDDSWQVAALYIIYYFAEDSYETDMLFITTQQPNQKSYSIKHLFYYLPGEGKNSVYCDDKNVELNNAYCVMIAQTPSQKEETI